MSKNTTTNGAAHDEVTLKVTLSDVLPGVIQAIRDHDYWDFGFRQSADFRRARALAVKVLEGLLDSLSGRQVSEAADQAVAVAACTRAVEAYLTTRPARNRKATGRRAA